MKLFKFLKKNDYHTNTLTKTIALDSELFKSGFGTDNNGMPKNDALVQKLISIKPSEKQLDYLELEYYNFIHFGMNTFTLREWGTGREKPMAFKLDNADTDQWCEVLKDSGSKGIIFTAKHHDGFCLWQSAYTEHGIKNSPYKNGRGDLVKELSDSCKKFGLKFGVYLSPWDMNHPAYGKKEYNDYFISQLTELLDGRYGEIFSVWFDGARGENAVMDSDFEYDFPKYYELIKKLQPKAVTCVVGEDVRWVGNEAGVSRESEWCVVSRGCAADQEFQTNADDGEKLKDVVYNASDVGSRELLQRYADLVWMPAEVDVSLHRGWFFHPKDKPKKNSRLLNIYFKSVGGNSSLLLNVPPNRNGVIDEKDAVRLREFAVSVGNTTANPVKPISIEIGDANNMTEKKELSVLTSDDRITSYVFSDDEYIVDFKFERKIDLVRIDLREDLRYSQRIEYFDVYLKKDNGWQLISNSTNIGNRRIILPDPELIPSTDTVRILIKQSRSNPVLRSVEFYE